MDILWIIFAHYIGDFSLQSNVLLKYKGQHWYFMFVHCFIWTVCVAVALIYVDLFQWWKLISLFATHYLIDAWKMKYITKKNEKSLFMIDQVLHLVQLAIVYFI